MRLNQYKHFQNNKNSLINNTGSENIVYSYETPAAPLSGVGCWQRKAEGEVVCAALVPCSFLPALFCPWH